MPGRSAVDGTRHPIYSDKYKINLGEWTVVAAPVANLAKPTAAASAVRPNYGRSLALRATAASGRSSTVGDSGAAGRRSIRWSCRSSDRAGLRQPPMTSALDVCLQLNGFAPQSSVPASHSVQHPLLLRCEMGCLTRIPRATIRRARILPDDRHRSGWAAIRAELGTCLH